MRRNSRTILARAALCIGLGLVTTIAVAWSCAAWSRVRPRPEWSPSDSVGTWSAMFIEESGFGAFRVVVWAHDPGRYGRAVNALSNDNVQVEMPERPTAAPLRDRHRWLRPLLPRAAETETTMHDARGWPFLALRARWAVNQSDFLAEGLELTSKPGHSVMSSSRALPYHPIPLGLTLNTLFFATLWSLLLFAPRAIRSHLRRRRNLCLRCAYSLRDLPPSSPCPECGQVSSAITPPPTAR